MDPSSSEKIMVGIGFTVHTFIAEVLNCLLTCIYTKYIRNCFVLTHGHVSFVSQLNSKITEYYRLLELDEQSEDLVGVLKICEPFSGAPNYSYMPESCPKDAITVGDLPHVSKSKLKEKCYISSSTSLAC
jgi:hypothetical protein